MFETKPGGVELMPELANRRWRTHAQEQALRAGRRRNRNHVLRQANEARRELERARREEIKDRKWRNSMRLWLKLFKNGPSTSPYCTWVNDPPEPEQLPPDWEPEQPKYEPLPDDPPF
jgi:hypothetical protein